MYRVLKDTQTMLSHFTCSRISPIFPSALFILISLKITDQIGRTKSKTTTQRNFNFSNNSINWKAVHLLLQRITFTIYYEANGQRGILWSRMNPLYSTTMRYPFEKRDICESMEPYSCIQGHVSTCCGQMVGGGADESAAEINLVDPQAIRGR